MAVTLFLNTLFRKKEVSVKCEIQVFITFIGVLWTGISSFETGRNSIEEEKTCFLFSSYENLKNKYKEWKVINCKIFE